MVQKQMPFGFFVDLKGNELETDINSDVYAFAYNIIQWRHI